MSEQASREDIESLAEKLDAFAASLPDQERDLLAQVLENASEGAETQAFMKHGSYSSSTAGMMALSLGPTRPVMRGISASVFNKPTGVAAPKE